MQTGRCNADLTGLDQLNIALLIGRSCGRDQVRGNLLCVRCGGQAADEVAGKGGATGFQTLDPDSIDRIPIACAGFPYCRSHRVDFFTDGVPESRQQQNLRRRRFLLLRQGRMLEIFDVEYAVRDTAQSFAQNSASLQTLFQLVAPAIVDPISRIAGARYIVIQPQRLKFRGSVAESFHALRIATALKHVLKFRQNTLGKIFDISIQAVMYPVKAIIGIEEQIHSTVHGNFDEILGFISGIPILLHHIEIDRTRSRKLAKSGKNLPRVRAVGLSIVVDGN